MIRKFTLAAAVLLVTALPMTARANFTCSTNQDCLEEAMQCDPGGIPCNDGVCDPSNPDSDAIGCVLTPNDSKCDDGNFCNGTEFCDGKHGCQFPPPPDCDDGIECTLDKCDKVLNKCTHATQDSVCSDGLYCDGKEKCDAVRGCVPGKPRKCNDGVSCTEDFCDENAKACVHTPDNSQCSDGSFCNGVEICDVTSGCQAMPPPDCNDHIPCTADSCSESAQACVHTPNNSQCSDGLFCDGVEQCNPNSGCQPGTPPNCNDGVSCTNDACDEEHDRCSHSPDDTICNDGSFCDGTEVCDATQGCKPGPPRDCDDHINCTADSCDEAHDRCNHEPNNSKCSDGKFCDGVEQCNPDTGCEAGPPPNCSDNIDCTNDTCVEATDSCAHTPNDNLCSDGLFCDGTEVCSATKGCLAGPPPDCNDYISCTDDSCSETLKRCQNVANDTYCSDNIWCDGYERCSPTLGCLDGEPIKCADNIDCTKDYCDELSHSCAHQPMDSLCSDGVFCNGDEICDDLLGCVPGDAVQCSDGITCTTDVCDETTKSCLHTGDNSACGDGVVQSACGEECDPDHHEICNNFIDDDGDGLIDCADPDCAENVATCTADCRLLSSCVVLTRDPAVISFTPPGRTADSPDAPTAPGKFSFHGRMIPASDVRPLTDGFSVTLLNDNGQIFRADVKPVDLKSDGLKRFSYRPRDLAAVKRDGGISNLSIRLRLYSGKIGYAVRVQAYGDFSRATLPDMTTQVYMGDAVGFVSATWSGEPGHWTLAPKDYDGGTP